MTPDEPSPQDVPPEHVDGVASGVVDVTGAHGVSNGGVAMFITVMLFITFSLWMGERDSCKRQEARTATRTLAAAAWNARMDDAAAAAKQGNEVAAVRFRKYADEYADAWRHAQPLNCGGIPDTRPKTHPRLPPRIPLPEN